MWPAPGRACWPTPSGALGPLSGGALGLKEIALGTARGPGRRGGGASRLAPPGSSMSAGLPPKLGLGLAAVGLRGGALALALGAAFAFGGRALGGNAMGPPQAASMALRTSPTISRHNCGLMAEMRCSMISMTALTVSWVCLLRLSVFCASVYFCNWFT